MVAARSAALAVTRAWSRCAIRSRNWSGKSTRGRRSAVPQRRDRQRLDLRVDSLERPQCSPNGANSPRPAHAHLRLTHARDTVSIV